MHWPDLHQIEHLHQTEQVLFGFFLQVFHVHLQTTCTIYTN